MKKRTATYLMTAAALSMYNGIDEAHVNPRESDWRMPTKAVRKRKRKNKLIKASRRRNR